MSGRARDTVERRVEINMKHVRHKCRVCGLGCPERTRSMDQVCMNQCDHKAARSSNKLEFHNSVEHTVNGACSGTRQRGRAA
eukprot:6174677-Pleurochrysis_carterae.AAC.3